MFNKNTQYINIIKSQQNIKINYQITDDSKIIKSEHSTFLMDNNQLSNDAKIKIAALRNTKAQTFISAICENTKQQIVTFDTLLDDNVKSIYFDTKHNIILDNKDLENDLMFYNIDNLDYFLSPFTILHNIINNKLEEKSLNILIHNENIYAILLNEEKRYVFSAIKKLPSYTELSNSNFYEDEISKQKLYEEMYLLKMQENISSIIQEFYDINKNTYFIQNTNIYYSIKQLSSEQIDTLNNDLLLNINYLQVNIDNYIFDLVSKPSVNKQSFIKKKKKKKSNKLFFILLSVFLMTLLSAGGVYWYKQNQKNNILKEKLLKQQNKLAKQKKELAKIEEISLPKHTTINSLYKKFIIDIFDTIGSDSTLKEIKLLKNESTLVYNFEKEDSYEQNLKPALLKIYRNSENILTSKNNNFYTAIIANNNVINPINENETKIYKPNKKYKNLSQIEIEKYLKTILDYSSITFHKKYNSKYESYEYIVTQISSTPESFFKNIEKLNNQYYSITLKFPIEFIKSNNKINIKYSLIFNQIKTK